MHNQHVSATALYENSVNSQRAKLLYLTSSIGTFAVSLSSGKRVSVLPAQMLAYIAPRGDIGYSAGYTKWGYMFLDQQVFEFRTPPLSLNFNWTKTQVDKGCAQGLVYSPMGSNAYVLIAPCPGGPSQVMQVPTPRIDVISMKNNKLTKSFRSPVSSLVDSFISPDGRVIWANGVAMRTQSGAVEGRVKCPGWPNAKSEIGVSPTGAKLFVLCPSGWNGAVVAIFQTKGFAFDRELVIPTTFSAKIGYLINRGQDIALVGYNKSQGDLAMLIISATDGKLESSTIINPGEGQITSCQESWGAEIAVITNNLPTDQFQHVGPVSISVINGTSPTNPTIDRVPVTTKILVSECSLS